MGISWRLIQTICIVALFFLGGTAVQAYYDQGNYNSLVYKYDSLQQANSVLSATSTLNRNEASYLRAELNETYQEMQSMLSNYDRTSFVYQSPGQNISLPIWTLNQTVPANSTFAWDLLDTFDNHVSVSSNSTLSFYIMNVSDVANYLDSSPYGYVTEHTGNSFQYDLRLSQGCAVYVLLIVNHSAHPALLEPDVTGTYAPTPFLTGSCSLP
ncbi:MAG: hypothetical protein JRN58_05585 [Nitrososphaerota archaeon]|nr:hypothetical protein [Nitrososphaerota archaeon]MDG6966607.1 hypothetical protein [Nitrososphaerota archaeon]MDG6978534.1 hypothetical protein [Nitrososphaerota archaeon]MDG7022015.1 hypothetical protein [Nitrososphaerota archaeon]